MLNRCDNMHISNKIIKIYLILFTIFVVIVINNILLKEMRNWSEDEKKQLNNIAIYAELHRQLKIAAAREGITIVVKAD